MKNYPVSILAFNGKGDMFNAAVLVEAASWDECLGKSHRLAAHLYPSAKGWARREVAVGLPDRLVRDPEKASLVDAVTQPHCT